MLDHNPFPGMDPWLENSTWGDIHNYLISELRNQIADQVPPGLFVKVEETVYLVHSESDIPSAIKALVPPDASSSGRLYAEQFAPFQCEIACVVVRSPDGVMRTFPPVETTPVTSTSSRSAR